MLLHELLDASATTARICADGCLVADVWAARTGIQEYAGYEVDPDGTLGLRDKAVVRVYRPESEVFSRDSLKSFAGAPVTINHPSGAVTADNWRQHGAGEIHGDVVRDGERVRVPIIVRDASAVEKVRTTHRQFSMGYSCDIDPAAGTTPDGLQFDASQRNIRINHIAAVPAARGGAELRIVDERKSAQSERRNMKIRIGDAEVDLSDSAAVGVAVGAINARLADAEAKLGAATADVAAKSTAIEAKDGEIAALKAQLADATDPVKVDARTAERAKLVDVARALHPAIVVDGKSDAAIRKEVVSAKLGDAAASLSDAAVDGAFVALAKDAKPVASAPGIASFTPGAGLADAKSVADAAWVKSIDNLNAWRNA